MTPEQQRIAIAEACGWVHHHTHPSEPERRQLRWRFISDLPDYLNDLNAMYEAEKALTPDQWVGYWSFLEPLACHPNHTSIIHATAAQRAEAFLRTLNLWKP